LVASKVVDIAQLYKCHTNSVGIRRAGVQIGAAAYIHRFGSRLNTHSRFDVCAVDGISR
jgi:hypothetical protein